MPEKIIAKFLTFVILGIAAAALFSGCANISSNPREEPAISNYFPPKVIGTIKSPDITESSGVAASRCQDNVLWTHNDSGDDAYIFAINTSGELLGIWQVPHAQNNDWEDIATFKDGSGKCFVYVGDIGDNKGKRPEHAVYKIKEPTVTPDGKDSTRKNPLTSDNTEIVRFRYPDYGQDSETLMVHPKTADIYVVTKRVSGPAGVYCLRHPAFDGGPMTLEKVADISVPAVPNGFVTGGDISPDGRRVVICDYSQGYEWTLPDGDQNFDDIWKQEPVVVDLGKRKHGESVTYSADGTSVFATSEDKNSPVIEVQRRQ
jgi:hypothetical protein